MFRPLVFAAAMTAAMPAAAFDITAMTDAERESFRSEVRDYILDNPEVLMEAIAVLEQRRADQSAQAETEMLNAFRDDIFEDGYSWVGGNPDGDVTVVEFLDYNCGYCKRSHPHVKDILAKDDNIRFIVKEFPILGETSVLGSQYAQAVRMIDGDDAYETVHDALMESRGQVSEQVLKRISEDNDLDHDAITEKMGDPEIARVIDANRKLAQALQIQGTPTFVINDTFIRGYVEQDQMEAIIENEREKAD